MVDEKVSYAVSYAWITPDELSRSNYPDDNFGAATIKTTSPKKLEYTLRLSPRKPGVVRIRSMKRSKYRKICPEEETEEALVDLSKKVREKVGGFFDINSQFGLVQYTVDSPFHPRSAALEYALENTRLITTIYLIGIDPFSHISKAFLFDKNTFKEIRKYVELTVNIINPNLYNRDKASAVGIVDKWDREYKKWNGHRPPLRSEDLEPPIYAMKVTQVNVLDFLEFLTEELQMLASDGLEVNYFGLSKGQVENATLPKIKSRIFEEEETDVKASKALWDLMERNEEENNE